MARTLRAAPSVLRTTIRFLPGAIAPAIERLQRTDVHANKRARPPLIRSTVIGHRARA